MSRPGWVAAGLKLHDLFLASHGGALDNWCRDINVMSRPDSGCPMKSGVATPFFEVATWAILAGQKGGRDLDFWRRDLEIPLWARTRS